ncbi:DUF1697 domain-containing protein [Ideonella sp. 4Y11]|uniref:DUF1697 domain-containing protein n=1 Tax=Ideonella aquatica TaxID=2824119 RepID=A0A940YHA6_9BURK|nr:DUF1697 domain-containing protein [Ideonella aquatica]MBQ0957829.1 DUF1697 domain-containing protein [Ideonella aquatica]
MTTCLVLLRGVNVGPVKRVPMAELRTLLGELGGERVATLLNSGNAVADWPRARPATLAPRIAAALRQRLGFDVPVVVKTLADGLAIAAGMPWPEPPDPARLVVVFTADQADLAALHAVDPLVAPDEAWHIGTQAAYLHCAGGLLDSRAAEALLGRAGQAVTTRNWATVGKLLALAQRSDR